MEKTQVVLYIKTWLEWFFNSRHFKRIILTWKTFSKCQTADRETFIVEIFVRTPLLLPFGKIQIRFVHLLKRFLF